MNTDDVVQEVFLRSLAHVGQFEPRHPGAMTAYLRQAVLNRIRDEIKKAHRRPGQQAISDNQPAGAPSPHEEAEAAELMESYEAALGRLRDEDRQAIVARVELKLPYREVAELLDKPTEEAAQMAVSRALVKLAREMGRS
jgi:RNA polymerase sigma factor (sigma-70 family)